jgi:16S rRNA (guanine966-N2)-methyltransferase
VRESVLGMLHAWFEDASVLDLFAGVGTMGLEAVSRGARIVVMVEQDRKIFALLKQNIADLGCEDRAVAVMADALGPTALARAERPVDIVFADPPYALMEDPARRDRLRDQLARAREVMNPSGFVVLRSPLGPEQADLSIAGFRGPEAHRYRTDQWVLLYTPEETERPRDGETE